MIEQGSTGGAYQTGKDFYGRKIERSHKDIEKAREEGNVHKLTVFEEHLEIYRLKSMHLDRRKERDLIK